MKIYQSTDHFVYKYIEQNDLSYTHQLQSTKAIQFPPKIKKKKKHKKKQTLNEPNFG